MAETAAYRGGFFADCLEAARYSYSDLAVPPREKETDQSPCRLWFLCGFGLQIVLELLEVSIANEIERPLLWRELVRVGENNRTRALIVAVCVHRCIYGVGRDWTPHPYHLAVKRLGRPNQIADSHVDPPLACLQPGRASGE